MECKIRYHGNYVVISRAKTRLKYGPIEERGLGYQEEYRNLIEDMENVDVIIEEWSNPITYTGKPFVPIKQKTFEAKNQNLSGKAAWEFANSALEEMTPHDQNLEEIPFQFEYRSRKDNKLITMEARGSKNLPGRKE